MSDLGNTGGNTSNPPPSEPPAKDGRNKALTFLFVLISLAFVAGLTYIVTKNAAVTAVVPIVLAFVTASATIFRSEVRASAMSVRWPVTAFVVMLLIGSNAITYVVAKRATPVPPTSVSPQPVKTGANPVDTPCIDDVQVAAADNSNPKLQLEILFSPSCRAGWAKVTRHDSVGVGNEIDISFYRLDDPQGPTRQSAVEPDVTSAFTTLIVRQSGTDRLCAEGSITIGAIRETAKKLCF